MAPRPISLPRRVLNTFLHLPSWYAPMSGIRRLFHILKGTKIGKGTEIGYHVLFDNLYPHLITVGSRSTLVKGSVILAHDRSREVAAGSRIKVGAVRIGDRVFIGANAVILPGVSVGGRSIVGAGAVVTRDVPEGKVVAGVPARIIGDA